MRPSRRSPFIPFALDTFENDYIRAERAHKDAPPGRYICLDPKCSSPVVIASSKRERVHFKHQRGTLSDCCKLTPTRNKTRHEEAKHLLAGVFSCALAHQCPMPILLFKTPRGGISILPFIEASQVVTEWSCPRTGRRADIALLTENNKPLLLVEVFHSHAVNKEKREDLANHWWIEVNANAAINNPNELEILKWGNLPRQLELAGQQKGLPLRF